MEKNRTQVYKRFYRRAPMYIFAEQNVTVDTPGPYVPYWPSPNNGRLIE